MTAAAAENWYLAHPELRNKKPAEYTVEAPEEPAEQPAPAQPAPDQTAATEQPAPAPSSDDTPTVEIPTGDDEKKSQRGDAVRRLADRTGAAFRSWKDSIVQPTSLAEVWRESGTIDARRIPADSGFLAGLWWASNRTDRLLLFGLLSLLWAVARPLRSHTDYAVIILVVPLAWCVVRPSHRWVMYGLIILITQILPNLVGG